MNEFPCRTVRTHWQSNRQSILRLISLVITPVALFSAGCAQLPSETSAPGTASSAAEWPTPTISNSSIPTPPEPTLLPQAQRPADKNPEILRNIRRVAPAPGASGSALDAVAVDAPRDRDVWQRIRGGFQMSALDGKLVNDWETYYATRPEYFARMIENSRPFLFHIITEVERRGMPAEIALLPMIESAYNPVAYSSAHASGIWQFIPSTGKNYGLKQNGWYDGRRDVIAATGAALDYLQNLHGMFKDWELALASYNWGEGAVQRAVDRNQAKGLPGTYKSLTNMPAETRNYLPKLIAVKNIIADPARFGIQLASIANEPAIEAITIRRHIDVALAAKFAAMTPDEFKFLNPAHTKPVINSNSAVTLVLPKHKVAIFMAHLNENEDKPLASWKTYTVKAGERAETIASKHNISVAELSNVNNIGTRRQIGTGQTILVPSSELQPELSEVPAPVPVAAQRAVTRAPARKVAPAKPAAGKKPPAKKPVVHTANR